eukprot:3205498-Rhodomonas_salina.2
MCSTEVAYAATSSRGTDVAFGCTRRGIGLARTQVQHDRPAICLCVLPYPCDQYEQVLNWAYDATRSVSVHYQTVDGSAQVLYLPTLSAYARATQSPVLT